MTTRETIVRSVEAGWTTRQQEATKPPAQGRDSVEAGDPALAGGGTVSDGQGTGTSGRKTIPQSPSVERGNEPRQAYRWSLRQDADAIYVNLGTAHEAPEPRAQGDGQLAPSSRERGGAPVVVREGENPLHGEGGQSDPVQRSRRTKRSTHKREDGRARRLKIAQKQRALAVKAQEDPTYRFNNLYSLLHWETWIDQAANAVLSRPGSDTAGVDGKTRDYFNKNRERLLRELITDLKKKRYEPLPVRRVHIPKAKGKTRPLGIPMCHSYCTSCSGLWDHSCR